MDFNSAADRSGAAAGLLHEPASQPVGRRGYTYSELGGGGGVGGDGSACVASV